MIPEKSLLHQDSQLGYSVFMAALALLSCMVTLVWFITRSVSRPISIMDNVVKTVATGNLNVAPITVKNTDEIGSLAENFNTMLSRLKTTVDRLNVLNKVIMENTTTAIIITNAEGRVLQCNSLARSIVWGDRLDPSGYDVRGHADIGPYIRNVLSYGNMYQNVQTELTMSDDTKAVFLMDVFTISGIVDDSEPTCVFVQLKDITELKILEEQVRRLDKLALIGQMAAGFAHESRNPLTAVKGFVQFLFEQSAHLASYKDLVLSELERITRLVNDFVLTTKPSHPQNKRVPLNDLVAEVTQFVHNEATMNNIVVTTMLEPDIVWAFVDPDQIKQALLNILKNAIEAIGTDGEIYVSLKRMSDKTLITIRDTGPGISVSDINYITNPFFTTKDNGTGLGLAVSMRII